MNPRLRLSADRTVAELILVSVGFLFLVEPVISTWQRHVAAAMPKAHQPRWVLRLAQVLKITLIAAIGTAIAGGAQTSSAFDSQDGIDTVRTLREASYCLSLGKSTSYNNAFLQTRPNGQVPLVSPFSRSSSRTLSSVSTRARRSTSYAQQSACSSSPFIESPSASHPTRHRPLGTWPLSGFCRSHSSCKFFSTPCI